MIHVSKLKHDFQVTVIDSKNHEVINSSKGLSSKADCIKNIKACADEIHSTDLYYQDDTFTKPRVYYLEKVVEWLKPILVTSWNNYETAYKG